MFEWTYIIIIKIIFFSIISYLLGSFSSAYWYGKWFYKTDIRKYGSENAGTTNMLRTFGILAAVLVFITDVLKSLCSVMLIRLLTEIEIGSEFYYLLQVLFGCCTVIGHIFPIFSGFKGGKGVASMLGVTLGILPFAAVLTLGVFLVVLLAKKIVSLSSITAAVAFPFITILVTHFDSLVLIIFSICACLLIIITHIKNIKKILKGEEKRILFKIKNKENKWKQ